LPREKQLPLRILHALDPLDALFVLSRQSPGGRGMIANRRALIRVKELLELIDRPIHPAGREDCRRKARGVAGVDVIIGAGRRGVGSNPTPLPRREGMHIGGLDHLESHQPVVTSLDHRGRDREDIGKLVIRQLWETIIDKMADANRHNLRGGGKG
jgi:hypothetical protein